MGVSVGAVTLNRDRPGPSFRTKHPPTFKVSPSFKVWVSVRAGIVAGFIPSILPAPPRRPAAGR